jgi:chromosome segregation ATPase
VQLHTERAQLAELALNLEALQGERAGLSARASEADQAVQRLEGRVLAARERIERAQGDLTEVHTDAAELKVANANLGRQLDEAWTQLRNERQRIQDLAAEITERDHLIARVESDLSLAQAEAEGLRRGVESLDAQRSTAEQVRETARHQHVRAERRVDGARAALHDARDTLDELRSVLGTVLFGSPDALDGPVVSTRADQATLPGVAIDPGAFDEPEQPSSEALDRKDAEVSEQRSRVAALLETLEMERDRLRTVDSSLRTLRPLVRDPEIVRRLDELLQLLGPNSP